MRYVKNVIILGTSHIAQQSIEEAKDTIALESPDIIALELDLPRFKKLMSKQKESKIPRLGKGFLFNLIGVLVEKYLGNKVGTSPGDDMKSAINAAKKNKIRIALIDQDIRITLQKLSKEFSWKEKLTLVKEIILAPFAKQKIKIDLTKVPEKKLINKMITDLKKKYPSLYKVLIDDRNKVMANNIKKLMKEYKKILVIVGAGHENDLAKLIK